MNEQRGNEQRPPSDEGSRGGFIERLLHRFRARDSLREDLEEVLAEAASDEDFSAHERSMLKNVLGFGRVRVSDVMVPRADIVSVASDTTLGEVFALFRTAGHSRLPAYGETLDEPLGMVHIRDFLDYLAAAAEAGAGHPPRIEIDPAQAPKPDLGLVDLSATLAEAGIVRPILFVPRSMPAIDLLVRMQASRTHIALVIDEYGGTDGLCSMEDLVEVVVGDIEDEHDETDAMIVRKGSDTLLADARARLEEVSEAIGIDLGDGVEAEDVDTVGGLIVTLAGRVPLRGEVIAGPHGLEFEVLDADPRRLRRIRVSRPRAAEGANAAVDAPMSHADRPHVGPASH